MIVFTVLISLLVVLLLTYLTKLLLWVMVAARKTANIPGPKPLPILGNALYFINIKDLEDAMQRILSLIHSYCTAPDKIIKFWLGPKLLIFLGNPKHVQTVLSSEHAVEKDSIYRFFHLCSNGMFATNGEEWAEMRKPVDPMLTKRKLENRIDMFHIKAIKLIEVIDKNIANDRTFNIRKYLAKYVEDTFFAFNFGADCNEIENEHRSESLDRIFERGIDHVFKAMVTVPYCLSYTYTKMSSLGRSVIKINYDTCKLIYKMTQQRKINKMQTGTNINESLFADLLLEKGEKYKLSPLDIGKLGVDFFIAASHSIGIMTSSAVLYLAMYPKHQDAVYEEQLEVIGADPQVQPTWEQLSKMSYLTRVFKEVTRLFTAPLFVKNVKEDIDLGDFKLPEGSSAVIMLYCLHRDPTIWSHPNEFYPDHFLPEESSKRPKFSYLPFSWGPRNCPGGLLAVTVFKIVISALIRKYYFQTDLKFEELKEKFSLFMDITQGQLVKKIPRSEVDALIT